MFGYNEQTYTHVITMSYLFLSHPKFCSSAAPTVQVLIPSCRTLRFRWLWHWFAAKVFHDRFETKWLHSLKLTATWDLTCYSYVSRSRVSKESPPDPRVIYFLFVSPQLTINDHVMSFAIPCSLLVSVSTERWSSLQHGNGWWMVDVHVFVSKRMDFTPRSLVEQNIR